MPTTYKKMESEKNAEKMKIVHPDLQKSTCLESPLVSLARRKEERKKKGEKRKRNKRKMKKEEDNNAVVSSICKKKHNPNKRRSPLYLKGIRREKKWLLALNLMDKSSSSTSYSRPKPKHPPSDSSAPWL